ncbi:MAG: hypothetical protein HUU50_05235 [Candidatus Brocadiae bacterium]|nr:hypothetical protein [Candidatus Brocadiia bacterium]
MAKGKKVEELVQTNESNSLEAAKSIGSSKKAPGQVGLSAPHTLDAIRRPKPEERVDKGERVFAGVAKPKIADQTYDCYNPIRKVDAPKKAKKEE